MDEQTPHRRRRQRVSATAAQGPGIPASSDLPAQRAVRVSQPVSDSKATEPQRVRQTGSSRPRSVTMPEANAAPAKRRTALTQSKATSDGTRVYCVSDEPAPRQRMSQGTQSRNEGSAIRPVFTSGDYPPSDINWPGEQTTPPRQQATARAQKQTGQTSGGRRATSQRTSAAGGGTNRRAPLTGYTATRASSQSGRSSGKQPQARLTQGYRPEPPPRRRSGSSGGLPPRRRKAGIHTYVKIAVAAFIVVGLVAGLYLGGSYLVEVRNMLSLGDGVFYPNLYINNISLGGMTQEEALEAVTAQVEQQMEAFSITIASTTGQSWLLNKDTLGMRYDVEERVNELWRMGREGNAAQRYEEIKELLQTPVQRYTALTYDISGLNSILTQIKAEVDRDPVNATRIADNTVFPPFAYTSEQVGYSLDVSAAYTQICDMIDRLESGTVTLTPTAIQPNVTRAQLEGEIVQIGYYETKVNTSKGNEGRTMNVTMGCEKFNHMTVASGARVSFNDVTGKREEKTGWYAALEIAYGEYTTGFGGGICQVSSTLYNACISAGLEIVKRSQHGLEVGYIEKGLDATVSNNGPDFIFRNNTGTEIYIAAGVESRGSSKYCVFIIYGRPDPDGYTRYLEGRIVEELPIPEATIKQDEDKDGDGKGDTYGLVYTDEIKEVSKGRVGSKVDTYLITKDAQGELVSEEYRYTDTFKAIAPVWYTGTLPRD